MRVHIFVVCWMNASVVVRINYLSQRHRGAEKSRYVTLCLCASVTRKYYLEWLNADFSQLQ